jgi:hypothetical protein
VLIASREAEYPTNGQRTLAHKKVNEKKVFFPESDGGKTKNKGRDKTQKNDEPILPTLD